MFKPLLLIILSALTIGNLISQEYHIVGEEVLFRISERFQRGRISGPRGITLHLDTRPNQIGIINGSADRKTNRIFITPEAIRSLPEDELAFLIAHECGHLMDKSDACENSLNHERHACEDTADWIGEQIMVGSGYSGYAGAGLMGRWMMMGDRASFLRQQFVNIFDSHHSEVERTNNLLASWRSYCNKFGCK